MKKDANFEEFIVDCMKYNKCWLPLEIYEYMDAHYPHDKLGSHYHNLNIGDDVKVFGRYMTILREEPKDPPDTYCCMIAHTLKGLLPSRAETTSAGCYFMDDIRSTCYLVTLSPWKGIRFKAELKYCNTASEVCIGWPLSFTQNDIKTSSCYSLSRTVQQHVRQCREHHPDLLPVEWGAGKERFVL